MVFDPLFRDALLACVIGGASLGLVGGFVMLLDMPFVGVGLSHAAFLGAVAGLLLEWDPLIGALAVSAVMALVMASLAASGGVGINWVLGLLFTFTMGLAFLLMARLPGARGEALNLMWGSLLTLSPRGVMALGAIALVAFGFVGCHYSALKTLLFNREIAAAAGVPANRLLHSLMLVIGLVVSAALPLVGGLLLFALLINPAAAALRWARRMSVFLLLCVGFGMTACLGGFWLSVQLDTPVGATIVLVSCVPAAIGLLWPRPGG